jgi:hypothetical protein
MRDAYKVWHDWDIERTKLFHAFDRARIRLKSELPPSLKGLRENLQILALAFDELANDEGLAYISSEYAGTHLGVSNTTGKAYINELVAKQILTLQTPHIPSKRCRIFKVNLGGATPPQNNSA